MCHLPHRGCEQCGQGSACVSGMNFFQERDAAWVGSYLQQKVPPRSTVERHTHRRLDPFIFVLSKAGKLLACPWDESVGVHVCVLCVYVVFPVFSKQGRPYHVDKI